MAADFDLVDRLDLAFAGQPRDLETDALELLRLPATEARVRIRHRLSELNDQPPEREIRTEPAQAAAQLAVVVNRDERAAPYVERGLRFGRCVLPHVRLERATREREELVLVASGDHRWISPHCRC